MQRAPTDPHHGQWSANCFARDCVTRLLGMDFPWRAFSPKVIGIRCRHGLSSTFLALTSLITWSVIGLYIFAPEHAAAWFGQIHGSQPLFFLATWAPATSAFLLVFACAGTCGLRRFLSRLLLWLCSAGWAAFVLLGLPLVFLAGSLIKGGPVLTPLPPEGAGPVVAVMIMMSRGRVRLARDRPAAVAAPHGADLGRSAHRRDLGRGLPAFFLSSTVHADWNSLPFFIGNVTLAVLVTPIFNRTGGSLIWPMLFHRQLISPFWPDAQP